MVRSNAPRKLRKVSIFTGITFLVISVLSVLSIEFLHVELYQNCYQEIHHIHVRCHMSTAAIFID